MAGIKGSKVFRYTDEMRSRAKEIFKERVPDKDSKRPFGLWSDLSKKMAEQFPELKEVPDMTLRSWIRNVCFYDKVGINERSKRNTTVIDGLKRKNKERNAEFIRTYPERLRKMHDGKIVLVNESSIVNAHTPIKHRCLVHGEESESAPAWLLTGRAMKCCGYESNKVDEEELNRRAELSGIKWITPYTNGDTPRDCECLTCGNSFNILPNALKEKIRRGTAETEITCPKCRSLLQHDDNINVFIDEVNHAGKYCEIYLFWDETYEWLKIGISGNAKKRAREGRCNSSEINFYEEEIWHGERTRAVCWATEQVALALSEASSPTKEDTLRWGNTTGMTEVRRASDWNYESERVRDWLKDLLDTCSEMGWIKFMLKFHPFLDPYAKKLLKNQVLEEEQ
tara:strand:+ start:980 stop:2170 length:1191 start_codon:yes stop_codon:yes gene_type:complete